MHHRALMALLATLLAHAAVSAAPRAQDVDHASDHPALPRYPGAVIAGYDFKQFEQGQLILSKPRKSANGYVADKVLPVEGAVTYLHYEVEFPGQKILSDPPFDPQLVEEFWRAFITSAGITMHITSVRGVNTHHLVEATFKGVARSLRDAVRIEGGGVPSTKGVL